MTIENSDLFIVGRGDQSFKITYDELKTELGTGGGGALSQTGVTITATPPNQVPTQLFAQGGIGLGPSGIIDPPDWSWYKDGVLIDGATSDTIDVTDPGTYKAVATVVDPALPEGENTSTRERSIGPLYGAISMTELFVTATSDRAPSTVTLTRQWTGPSDVTNIGGKPSGGGDGWQEPEYQLLIDGVVEIDWSSDIPSYDVPGDITDDVTLTFNKRSLDSVSGLYAEATQDKVIEAIPSGPNATMHGLRFDSARSTKLGRSGSGTGTISYWKKDSSTGWVWQHVHQTGAAYPAEIGAGYDGYLSDYYYVDGQDLPAENFVGDFDGKTGPLDSSEVIANVGNFGANGFYLSFDPEETTQVTDNTRDYVSMCTGPVDPNYPFENAFDGSVLTYCEALPGPGLDQYNILSFKPTTPIPYSTLQIQCKSDGNGSGYFKVNGQNVSLSTNFEGLKTIDVAGPLREILWGQDSGSYGTAIADIRVDGNRLKSDPAFIKTEFHDLSGNGNNFACREFAVGNTDQVWSNGISNTGEVAFNASSGSGFNGSQYAGSCLVTGSNTPGDTSSLVLNWDVPAELHAKPLTVGITDGGSSGFNNVYLSTNLFATQKISGLVTSSRDYVFPGTKIGEIPLEAGTTQLNISYDGDGAAGLVYVIVDNELLVDSNIQDTVLDTPMNNYAVLETGKNGNLVATANGTNLTYVGEAGTDYYYEADGVGVVHTGGAAFSSTDGVVYNLGQQPFIGTPTATGRLYQTWEQWARTALGYAVDRIAKLEQRNTQLEALVEEARTRLAALELNEISDDAVDTALITLIGNINDRLTALENN